MLSVLSPDSNPPTHYSSQDSLPDSPYSSQSLESQPEPPDQQRRHTRGSMPNLNRRGRGGVGGQQVGGPGRLAAPGLGGRKASASATRAPVAAAAAAGASGQYGLSRQHTTSDPRLLQQQQQQGHQGRGSQLQMQPPQRGYSMPRGGDRRTPEVSNDEMS